MLPGRWAWGVRRMKFALVVMAAVSALAVYTAWMNGAFLRCPHCRKIGSWRFDPAETAVDERDEDGVLRSSRQVRVCRKCGQKVLHTWSDRDGPAIEKDDGGESRRGARVEPWN